MAAAGGHPPRAITLVLSGGGAKTGAHLGALRVLLEAGLVPTRYVATSMGAVIGAMLASGLDPDQVVDRLRGVRRRDLFRLNPGRLVRGLFAPSVLHPERFYRLVARLLPVESFAELTTPLTVTATDLTTGEQVLYGAGGEAAPLREACCASAALPPFFPPVVVNRRRCSDGGLRSVVPLDVASRFPADLVVACDTGVGFDAMGQPAGRAGPALLRLVGEAQGVLMASNTALLRAQWLADPDRAPLLWIRPRIRPGDTFAPEQLEWYVAEGERAARAVLTARHS
jgi:NTE family protein